MLNLIAVLPQVEEMAASLADVNIVVTIGNDWKIFTLPAPDVVPGRQLIGVIGSGQGAQRLLEFLTGADQEHRDCIVINGTQAVVTPHDNRADEHLGTVIEILKRLRANQENET